MRWFRVIVFFLLSLTAFETWRLQNIANLRTKEIFLRFLTFIIPEPDFAYLYPEIQADPVSHSNEIFHHYMLEAKIDIDNELKRSQLKRRSKCPTYEFFFNKYLDNVIVRPKEEDQGFFSLLKKSIGSTIEDVFDRVHWIRRRSVLNLKKGERRRQEVLKCIAKHEFE